MTWKFEYASDRIEEVHYSKSIDYDREYNIRYNVHFRGERIGWVVKFSFDNDWQAFRVDAPGDPRMGLRQETRREAAMELVR